MKSEKNKHIFKSFLIIISLTIGILGVFYLININENTISTNTINQNKINKVCINDVCFNVEIANNEEDRKKGLMNRHFLPENEGMLFIFEKEEIYPFWMKNTLISLDIIWINENMKIIDIKEAEPCISEDCKIYNPRDKALYVLEINKGLSRKHQLMVNDKITFK